MSDDIEEIEDIDAKPPSAVARIGDALLLDDGAPGRALFQGRPAAARMQWLDAAEARVIAGMARAIGVEGAAPLLPVRMAVVNEHGHAVVVFDDASGVPLLDVVARVLRDPSRRFPVDVACRLALHVASLTAWMPRVRDFVVTWDGLLRASPVPMLPSSSRTVGGFADVRYFSPALVRGDPADAARDSLHAAGILAFELIAGALPFDVDASGGMFPLLNAILQEPRVPLLRRRADVDAALATAVDGMLTLAADERVTTAHARAVLGARACSEEEATSFLQGFVGAAFPRRRAADLAFWEEARTLDARGATEVKILEEPKAITDLAAAWRSISNRATRTD